MSQEMIDITWRAMGTDIQLVIGPSRSGEDNRQVAREVEQLSHDFEQVASRFKGDSELSKLNRDPRGRVEASEMLRRAIASALQVAQASGGLVDPTLSEELEQAGYAESWQASRRIDLEEALPLVSDERPARPNPNSRWVEVSIDSQAITRPVGVRLEVGATGKGLYVDMASELLAERFDYWMVSAGGDMRSGGAEGLYQQVEIRSPLTDEVIGELLLDGALATSGISRRIWLKDGKPAHHLLDPSTGQSAFTGLVQVSAAAPSCLEAERLAGQALLSGPEGARALLSKYGGLLVSSDGQAERIEERDRLSAADLLEVYG